MFPSIFRHNLCFILKVTVMAVIFSLTDTVNWFLNRKLAVSRLQHLTDFLLRSNRAPTLIQNVVKTKHLDLNTYVIINHVLKHHFLPNYNTTNFILTKSQSRAMLSFTDSTGLMTGSNFFFNNICYFNTFQN